MPEEGDGGIANPPEDDATKEASKRRARTTRQDIIRLGFTLGCPGCKAISRNAPAQNHTESCRDRLEKELTKEGGHRARKVVEGNQRYTPAAPPAKRPQVPAES